MRPFNRNQIKYIAIFAMLLDHIALGFLPDTSPLYVMMHFFGRITGPVMCFFIAEGYHYSRNVARYLFRLGLFAVISWVPFAYFSKGKLPLYWNGVSYSLITQTGVIYTLFLGLCAILVFEARDRYGFLYPLWMRAGVIFLLMYVSQIGDWSYYGVSLCLIFHIFRNLPRQKWICYSVISALMILEKYMQIVDRGGAWWLVSQEFGLFLVPILFEGLYDGREVKNNSLSKWFFYVFYPAHLLVLGLIRW